MAIEINNNSQMIQEKHRIITGLDENGDQLKFEDLLEDEQNALVQFYESVDIQD